MDAQACTTIDIEFIRTDGQGLKGKRVERFERIDLNDLIKYGAQHIGWRLLADRFYDDEISVKEKFVLISVNIENE